MGSTSSLRIKIKRLSGNQFLPSKRCKACFAITTAFFAGWGFLSFSATTDTLVSPKVIPLWEWTLNRTEETPLPILQANTDASPLEEKWDGSSVMDSYGELTRYNDQLLILAVRENGINETASDYNHELASQFPDRSLIWIDPDTGAPLGLALNVGLFPVNLDFDFLSAGGASLDYYFSYEVTESGSILVGYKNLILEYPASSGSINGFPSFGSPRVLYTQPDDDSPFWPDWRWATIQSQGSGADMKIMAGSKTWRPNMGPVFLETNDGTNWTSTWRLEAGFEAASGGVSFPYFGSLSDDLIGQWIYSATYPGANDGLQSPALQRHRVTRSFGGAWEVQSTESIDISPQSPVENPAEEYQALFITDVQLPVTSAGVSDWIVVYSTPSYNSDFLKLENPTPGWIALHPRDGGEAVSTHLIPVSEADEVVQDATRSSAIYHATMGSIRISIPPRAKPGSFEILWSSGIYGYGRYLVGEIGSEPIGPKILSVKSNQRGMIVSWISELPGRFQLQRTTSLISPIEWENIGSPVSGSNTLDRNPPNAAAFYRVISLDTPQ